MHILGLQGMPRRVYTYVPEMGWGSLNALVSLGGVIFAASFLLLFWNMITSWRRGEPSPDDPWGASTLEWATSSPPPPYNFALLPVVSHRDPLWATPGELPVMTGLSTRRREVIVTTATEATPDTRESSPEPSIWPLLAAIAVGVFFIGSIFTPWAVVWGSPPVAITLIGWFWPKGTPEDEE